MHLSYILMHVWSHLINTLSNVRETRQQKFVSSIKSNTVLHNLFFTQNHHLKNEVRPYFTSNYFNT